MPRFRKKPVEVQAVQWEGTAEGATAIIDWILGSGSTATYRCSDPDRCAEHDGDTPHSISIQTLEGAMRANLGDWIIKGVQDEFYPCKPDIFAATYEAAGDQPRLLDCGFCYEEQGEEVHPHPECPEGAASKQRVIHLETALHTLRFALDRFIGARFNPDPRYLRELLDAITKDPGEPCDSSEQHTRALRAEAALDRVRKESARIRSITPTWGPVADLIDAAVEGPVHEQRERPAHPDGTPYRYDEIVAEGWGYCEGCRVWSTATPARPHQCSATHVQGPADGEEAGNA